MRSRHSIWTSGLWGFLAAIGMLAVVAYGNATEDRAPGQAPYRGEIWGVRSQEEALAVTRLLAEAYEVLRSDEFSANLRALQGRYPTVYARGSDQSASPDSIARIVGGERWGIRYAPVQVGVTDDTATELASAGDGGNGRYAGMEIGRAVLGRYAASDPVKRSCAVNVAAHEFTHTISLTPVGFVIAFTDTREGEPHIRNRRDPSSPVASYLIGAVAQCTWLQRQGRVERSDVAACIEVFGVQGFNWSRCGQFADGATIEPRPGLATPSRPL